MKAVDFFCGGGGMTCGLLQAGINVLCGIDSNPACKSTYENNNKIPYIEKDITQFNANDLSKLVPEIQDRDDLLLVGCAPCQPFSILRHDEFDENGNEIPHKSVNLLTEFGNFVEALLPAHILVENVPGLKGKGKEILETFKSKLKSLGYELDEKIIYAKNYGVPQNRRRYILIASRLFTPKIPEGKYGPELLPYHTVRETISAFPPIKAGESCNTVINHKSANLKPILIQRIQNTPHNGGSRTDWPDELYLKCHKSFKGHTDVYGRMKWDEPAPTLTVKCYSLSNGRFGHPEQDRAISLREAAAIQSFPDDYAFIGSMQEIGKQIGNAVPVLLAKTIGEYILSMAEDAK